jgi:transposase
MIVIGADTHKRSHALAAVDAGTGRVRGQREIKAEEPGHLAAVRWARGLDEERVWAIEDCRAVARRFEQTLLAAGERVVRVAPHRMGASRKGERRPGKSDQIDALAIARAVVADGIESFPAARLDERAMEIRLLSDHRNDLVADRTRTVNRLRWHLLGLCPELERSIKPGAFNQARVLDRVDRRLRRLPAGARARVAREQVAHLRRLNRGVEQLKRELLELVRAHRPQLLAETGCGPLVGGDPDRPHRRRTAVPLGRELRAAIGHRADPLLLGQAQPAPAQPRRRPPAQPRAAHHRRHPGQPRPGHQGLPRAQAGRGQDQEGSAPLPQAAPGAPLSPPALPPSRDPSTRSKQWARRPRRPTPTGWKHRRRRAHTDALPQLEPR